MNDEVTENEDEAVVSEQLESEPQDESNVEPKMVPLKALQATRRKLQEAEAKAQHYQDSLMRAYESKANPAEVAVEEDEDALVEHRALRNATEATKREILEAVFQDSNPEAVNEINKFLKPILEKKPWLAASVDSALNRYSRAFEIVNDYRHLIEPKKEQVVKHSRPTDAQRIVQNANKPGSPVQMGKSARPDGAEYLKSIQGKKEFREYRQKMLRGEI